MSGGMVEEALRSTYQLSGADADRLRRLTRDAGLDAENVLSRLAIVTSVSADPTAGTPVRPAEPSKAARTKDIKGGVLLGRARQAALMLVMVAAHPAPDGETDLRAKVVWHWARGLRMLETDARVHAGPTGPDPMRALSAALVQLPDEDAPRDRGKAGGLGSGDRDRAAAAVGRLYPRWPTEVRRLVAMAARLDPDRVDLVARRLADAAEARGHRGVTEKAALDVMQNDWGLNRLGMDARDRALMAGLLRDDPDATAAGAPDSPAFLAALGLVTTERPTRPTERGRTMGPEAAKP